jgi:hypothetical protein
MSLDALFESEEVRDVEAIKAKIKQRRAQMLIHSCIYYELDDNVISDHKWQYWADELEVLQRENPDCCKLDFYDWNFKDWTGATGNHLPHRDPWVNAQARWLLTYVRAGENNG